MKKQLKIKFITLENDKIEILEDNEKFIFYQIDNITS